MLIILFLKKIWDKFCLYLTLNQVHTCKFSKTADNNWQLSINLIYKNLVAIVVITDQLLS